MISRFLEGSGAFYLTLAFLFLLLLIFFLAGFILGRQSRRPSS